MPPTRWQLSSRFVRQVASVELEAIKRGSETRLRAVGVAIDPNLPLIDSLDEVQPRPARDAAGRACALGYIASLGFGADRDETAADLSRYHLDEWVTSRERALLDADAISEQDRIDCTWAPEAIQALAWALGLVSLDPTRHCDEDLASNFPVRSDPSDFIATAEIRSIRELQEEVDFHYRLHWWVRSCELSGARSGFDTDVVVERRRALEWLYGGCVAWDEISLDT